jgi:hypothetical protein
MLKLIFSAPKKSWGFVSRLAASLTSGALALLMAGAPSIAPAATFTVSNTDDSGAGSLRQAIIDANGAAGDDVIVFAGGPFGDSTPDTITLGGTALQITSNITVQGPGTNLLTISGNNASTVFIASGTSGNGATLSGLTITGGSIASGFGGGINNSGILNVTDCAVSGNSISGFGQGGGIYTLGTLRVTNSTISGNSIGNNGQGGGIGVNSGTVIIDGCTISGNTIGSGGMGGGIQGFGSWTITNSTFFNNSVAGLGQGGAMHLQGSGPLTIVSSTIAGNSADSGGGIAALSATPSVSNTIIANNVAPSFSPDVNGSFSSGGFNLIENTTGASGFIQPTDITGADPNLVAALANNGGPTQTLALMSPSQAIDSGNPAASAVDQRRFYRAGVPDRGAFEFGGSPNLTVTTLLDENDGYVPGGTSNSLRECIAQANTLAGDDTIVFDAGLSLPGTITLGGTELAISSNLAIEGPGASLLTISGNNASRVFFVNANSRIANLTIANGQAGDGAGVDNFGALVIDNCILRNNTVFGVGVGGGARNLGSLTITNSTIRNNASNFLGGGGLANAGGTLNISNCTISNNNGNNFIGGGGVLNVGGSSLTISNSTIVNNSATIGGSGGGVGYFNGSAISVNNTIIANNTASSNPDVSGPFTSGGYNLVENVGSVTAFNATGDITGVDPLLDPAGLQDQGGPTPTIALCFSSPAVDAGNTALTTDQRGISRPQGLADDIGAFEGYMAGGGCPNEPLVVTTVADENDGFGVGGTGDSLRECIAQANLQPGDDTIIFAAVPFGDSIPDTILLTASLAPLGASQLVIDSNIDIQGPGAALLTIDGQGLTMFKRVFEVTINSTGAGSILSGMTITGGFAGGGGGVYNYGRLAITSSAISGNSGGATGQGGGVYNHSAGTLLVTNSTISGNSVDPRGQGGGMYNAPFGTLTITNSTISGNSVGIDGQGGGMYNAPFGTLTITNSTISENFALGRQDGIDACGGVFNSSGANININNTIVSYNIPPHNPDVIGDFTSGGYNLIGMGGLATGFGGTDILGEVPLLGPLQDNGGPTLTHALLGGQPRHRQRQPRRRPHRPARLPPRGPARRGNHGQRPRRL